MSKKVCYIAGAGEFVEKVLPCSDDYVIAADGGYRELLKHRINASIILGDFDSLGCIPNEKNTVVYPIEKDETDMEIAVKHGIEIGCRDLIINGGCGGRLDHTLANMQILMYIAMNQCRGYLVGDDYVMTAIHNQKLSFYEGASGIVSVFSLCGEAKGVTEVGFKYPLESATLLPYKTIGVSNEINAGSAFICVEDGCLVVMFHGDVRKMIEVN